jgi:hypothetical protein
MVNGPMLLISALMLNGVFALFVSIFWQGKIMVALLKETNWNFAALAGLADQSDVKHKVGLFRAGDFFPELRRKWKRALTYLICSWVLTVIVVICVALFFPDALG